jgi:predicted dehydrogenase
MSGKAVRFAVIGSNFITDAFLASSKRVRGFELAAVYSRTAERATEYAALHGAPRTFTSLTELGQCDEVDAVYIASPTSEHCRQAIQLLEAGKHVLVEKPACSHAVELEQVLAAARASGKTFMEAMRPLKTPNFLAVQAALAELGPVRHFAGSFCQLSSRWPAYLAGERPNAFLPELSNGALMDLGCYAVYSAVALLGPPDEVTYAPLMLPTGVDGGGTVLLQYAEGTVATLVISKMSHTFNYSELQTEGGTVRVNNLGQYDEVLLQKKGDKQPTVLGGEGPPGLENLVFEVSGARERPCPVVGLAAVCGVGLTLTRCSVMPAAAWAGLLL